MMCARASPSRLALVSWVVTLFCRISSSQSPPAFQSDCGAYVVGPIICGHRAIAASASAVIAALQTQGKCNCGISSLCWMHYRYLNKGWYWRCSLCWAIPTTAPATLYGSAYSCTLGRLVHSTKICWALSDQRRMFNLTKNKTLTKQAYKKHKFLEFSSRAHLFLKM